MKYWLIGLVSCTVALAIAAYLIWQTAQSPPFALQALGYVFAVLYGVLAGAISGVFLVSLCVIAKNLRALLSPRTHSRSAFSLPATICAMLAVVIVSFIGFRAISRDIYAKIAKNPEAEPAALWRIANIAMHRHDRKLLFFVARNPSTPPEMFPLLISANYEEVTAAIIRNPNLDLQTLTRLAEDPSSNVRLVVAASPRISDSVLDRLVTDPDARVRKMAQYHKNLREKEINKKTNP